MEPINNPDTSCEDFNYWEKVLLSHGLSMKRGHQTKTAAYIGTINNLLVAEKKDFVRESGKVKPSGNGPDKE